MPGNEEKLIKMLKYVSEHNDFYKKRIKEYGIPDPLDITQWPILTRRELQENRYNMFSDGYKSKYFNQQLRRQSSSGSTGVPVNVYWDYKDWYASNLCLWRKRQEWYGIRPSERYCVFTLNAFGITPEEGKIYYLNEPKNILSFNVSLIRDEHGYEQMAEKINEFKPDWLYIQPFVLNQLIRAYKTLGIKPAASIRYIESVGEILTSDLRRRAEEMFHVKVTNMYGSEEMNGIAMENPDGDMQIFNDNVFLEVKNEEGISSRGEGESIITNLNNFAMPLIRYNQGDMTCIERKENATIISSIMGRTIDIMPTKRTIQLNPLVLLELMSHIINQFPDTIRSYHYVYNMTNCQLSCFVDLYEEKSDWFISVKKELELSFQEKVTVPCIKEICVVNNSEDSVYSCKRMVIQLKK